MEWSGCMSLLQGYLENSPLIVLGSGASMPYELPSMGGLAEEIKKSSIVISDPNYSSLCTAVDNLGLEGAIDTVNLLPQTLHEIRSVVWKAVNVKDLLYFEQHPIDPPKALVELIKKVLAPTPNKAAIVTTNYDRLAEYAADGVGARKSAVKSQMVKSTSCPTAEIIGVRQQKISRASASSLKLHKSSSEPPPRPTINTSHSLR